MKNRELWDAYPALVRFGQSKMPASVAWRVALNKNHLQPSFEALDETRRQLAVDLKVTEEHVAEEAGKPEFVLRLRDFERQWRDLLAQEVPWKSPAHIDAKVLQAIKEFSSEDVAPLILAGIIINPDGFELNGNGNGKE